MSIALRRLGGIVVILVVVGGVAYRVSNAPVDPRNTVPVEVMIPQGAGARAITNVLHTAGVLRSSTGFLARVIFTGARGNLKAGTYRFSRAESAATILRRIREGDALPADIAVTIPEGFTLEEIAARLEKTGVVHADDFRAAARAERFRSAFAFLASAPDGPLEGYLFPDTYRFFPGTDASVVVRRMLEQFGGQFDRVREEAGGLRGHSVHDVVTMASIVEREVRSSDDRRLVAGVLWSRTEHGVALQADATVRYAITTWDRPLTVKDLNVDSPYNTRKFASLPPGPIGSPGVDSLRATLTPQVSDFFYYLSARDGRTIFSKTLEEHNAAIRAHLR